MLSTVEALMVRQTTALVHQPRPVFYRYQESALSDSRIVLVLSTFLLLKTTPRGAWIDVYGLKKFVLLTARKRYACPTKEEALASYQARKQRHVEILRAQLLRAEAALRLTCDGQIGYY
jgi:hypothetical protein